MTLKEIEMLKIYRSMNVCFTTTEFELILDELKAKKLDEAVVILERAKNRYSL